MPIQTIKAVIIELLLIDVTFSGGLQAIIYWIVGALTPLQIVVIALNGILITLRIIKIIKNWKAKKYG